MRIIAKPLLLAGLLLSSLFLPNRAYSQEGVQVLDQRLDYVFNSSFDFTVSFASEAVIQEAFVLYHWEGGPEPRVYEGTLEGNESLSVSVALGEENKPALETQVRYWFRFATDHGDIYESEQFSFLYEDNRYPWRSLESAPFTLYWHNGDDPFAQSIVAAASLGLLRTQELIDLQAPQSVDLRVYDNVNDVQLLADQAGFAWQAGHTDPAAGLLLFSLPPGSQQSFEVQRQVPHEVAHLMLYQSFGAETYSRFPVWLNEGIASYAELYSDPLQAQLLELAGTSNSLLPMISLCQSFPQDPATARLAYAQASSFTTYLYERYNRTGFGLLVDAYAHNSDCLTAPIEVFGKDLAALEADWQAAAFSSDQGLAGVVADIPFATIFTSAGIAVLLFIFLRLLSGKAK